MRLPCYWSVFVELIGTPFQHVDLIWGIVPLYFGLLLNELTSTKASLWSRGVARWREGGP